MSEKVCSRCRLSRPLADFGRYVRSPDGLKPACRACLGAVAATAYRADLDASRARARAAGARARTRDPEGQRRRQREWHAANPGKQAEYDRVQRERYPERFQARFKAWVEANPEANRERVRAWSQANPQRVAEHTAERKARKLDLWVEDVDRDVVWARDEGRCRLCGLTALPGWWHLEHLTPLVRGGEHSYANTAVSHPACNLAKGRLTLVEFWERLGRDG